MAFIGRLVYGAALFVPVLMGSGCARHLRLQVPHTSAGARYVCAPQAPCQPATTDIPEERNRSGTAYVILPEQCAGALHEVVVFDADTSEPSVDVTCAPLEEPIEEMQ